MAYRQFFPVVSDSSVFWASGGAKVFPKLDISCPRTPMNHRAKFDAASFILGGEIRNRTKLQTNSKRYTCRLRRFMDWQAHRLLANWRPYPCHSCDRRRS